MKYFFILLSSFLLACNGKSVQKDNADTAQASDILTNSEEISISENKAPPQIIDSVYVVRNSEGKKVYGSVSLLYRADEESAYGASARLGEKLYVVGDNGDWLRVWTPVWREESGSYLDESVYGVLYVKKELTGDFEELKVGEDELQIISEYYTEDKERRISKDTLSLELISENEYLKQKSASVSLLVRDTLAITKKNGKIVLPCTEKSVTLSDVESDGDNSTTYIYMGQIPALNVYLIRGIYYESGSYFFIDKNSGERTASFSDFPSVSPDGKYVVDMWGSLYDDCTEFALSKLKEGDEPETMTACYFTKWLPFNSAYYKEIDYFWGNDNCVYVKIQAALLAAQVYEDYAAQYIKIKIGILADE